MNEETEYFVADWEDPCPKCGWKIILVSEKNHDKKICWHCGAVLGVE